MYVEWLLGSWPGLAVESKVKEMTKLLTIFLRARIGYSNLGALPHVMASKIVECSYYDNGTKLSESYDWWRRLCPSGVDYFLHREQAPAFSYRPVRSQSLVSPAAKVLAPPAGLHNHDRNCCLNAVVQCLGGCTEVDLFDQLEEVCRYLVSGHFPVVYPKRLIDELGERWRRDSEPHELLLAMCKYIGTHDLVITAQESVACGCGDVPSAHASRQTCLIVPMPEREKKGGPGLCLRDLIGRTTAPTEQGVCESCGSARTLQTTYKRAKKAGVSVFYVNRATPGAISKVRVRFPYTGLRGWIELTHTESGPHYIAYTRRGTEESRHDWYYCNDTRVKHRKKETIEAMAKKGTKGVVVLFYSNTHDLF
jgi:hypothetical protein